MAHNTQQPGEPARSAESHPFREAIAHYDAFLEEVTKQSSRYFGVPICILTLAGQDRVWANSVYRLDLTSLKSQGSLCDLVAEAKGVMVIPDTLEHPVASTLPLVTDSPGIRFFAAAPLRTQYGYNIGALCLMDVHPRNLSERDRMVLQIMANWVVSRLESQSATVSGTAATFPETELFAGGPVVIFKWRAAEGWPVDYVSPNVSQFGYNADEFVKGTLVYAHIVHPEDLDRVAAEVEEHTRRGDASFTQEYRIVRKNGQACWVYDYTTVVRDAAGQITHYYGYILDISSRKDAERALQESWSRYNAAIESFPGFVYIATPDFKIQFANQRMATALGGPFIGHECFRILHHRSTPCPCCDSMILERGETIRWEGISPRDRRWYHTLVVPLRQPTGSWLRMALSQDITDRKEAERNALKRESILGAVAKTGELLLRSRDWQVAIPEILSRLGHATEASRCYLVENRSLPSGAQIGIIRYEWTAPGVPSRLYSPLSQEIRYDQPGFRTWAQRLAEGRTIDATVRDLPEAQAKMLQESGIYSLVALPVHREQHWWGFIGFDFCGPEHRCGPVELEALRTAAVLFGTLLARQHMEQALQKSIERQRVILNAIPDLMFRLRSDGTFLDFHAERESDLAVSADQIIGNRIMDLLPAAVADLTMKHIRAALQTRQLQTYEYELNIRGTLRQFETRMVVSGPDEVLAIVRDITQRTQAERYLRTLWKVAEQTPDMTFICDTAGCFLYVNPAFEKVTGYRAEELVGKKPNILKSGKHSLEFYEKMWKDLMSGQIVHAEFINRRKDGSLYVQDTTIIPIRDEKGQIVHFVAVAEDITDRRQQEEAIRKLAAFPEANPNAVLEFDSQGNITYFNPAAQKMVGQLGCSEVSQLLPTGVRNIVTTCLSTGRETKGVEVTLGAHTLSWSFYPIPAASVVHAYGTDITDRLSLETQVRHLQKMEAVGRLAGGIAHDFNNILTAILGYSSLLLADPNLPSSARKQVEEIVAAGERAAQLTQQLLTFSRRQVMQRQPISVNAVLERLSGMLRRLIREDIELSFSFAPDVPLILGDATMLEQVVMNMVINARDAMPGGGQIRIQTYVREVAPSQVSRQPEACTGTMVCIEVADTGCGMDEHIKARLFEPFFTTKEKGKGTGLGLATAYGIVRQHGGWIEVESEPGHGSVFRVFLPACHAPAPTSVTSAGPALYGGRATVLIVEDEHSVRTLASTVLASAGYRVFECDSPAQALQIWREHAQSIDILLVDLVMPGGLSGIELAQQFHGQKKDLKVVLTSGYPTDEETQHLCNFPFAFLSKPFSADQLTRTIHQVLRTS